MSTPSDTQTSTAHEETLDDQGGGVETEVDFPRPVSESPWDIGQIRIRTSNFSVRSILDMIHEKELDLAADFRPQSVWTHQQRSALIESILLGIPLPSFFFNEDLRGRLQVIDGIQRLTTIRSFVANDFKLGRLTYFQLEGCGYDSLSLSHRRRIQQTTLICHILDAQVPYEAKVEIFKRTNVGGTPLSAQEIRHGMSSNRSRELLKRIVASEMFASVMGPALIDHPRMADREIALRLIAFHVIPMDEYASFGGLDGFLGKVTELLDQELTEMDLSRLEGLALAALANARIAFGEFAFRKHLPGDSRRNPVNRALVECWGYVLAEYSLSSVSQGASGLREANVRLMNDSDFLSCITGNTGDPHKVKGRLHMVRSAVREVLS